MTERSTGALFPHVINPYVEGEICASCPLPATHKVGEEDGPEWRHNFTQYLCCFHFGTLMGPVAMRVCQHPPEPTT